MSTVSSGYVNEAFLTSYGITNPAAYDLVGQASRIVDLHVPTWLPFNTTGTYTGFKFPRTLNNVLAIPDDAGVVPTLVQYATCEQIIFMLNEGMDYVRGGGDDSLSVTTQGYSKQRANAANPLLAPMAKLYLKSFMTKVGYNTT